METRNPRTRSLLSRLTDELADRYGFETWYLKSHPLTFDTLCAVLDDGHIIDASHVAYYLTGDRTHLPAEEIFNGIERIDGTVDDEYLKSIGSAAASNAARVTEVANDASEALVEAETYQIH